MLGKVSYRPPKGRYAAMPDMAKALSLAASPGRAAMPEGGFSEGPAASPGPGREESRRPTVLSMLSGPAGAGARPDGPGAAWEDPGVAAAACGDSPRKRRWGARLRDEAAICIDLT